MPANTFIASAEAVVLAGATPVFADVSPDTLLLTPAQLEAAITPRTAAVIVVHLYGQMPDMDALNRSRRTGGHRTDRRRCAGSWRELARQASRFHRARGLLQLLPGKEPRRLRRWRRRGDRRRRAGCPDQEPPRSRPQPAFPARSRACRHQQPPGRVQAVVLNAKLPWLDAWTEARRSIAARYRAAFGDGAARLVAEEPGSRGAYHLAVVRVPDRARVQRQLAEAGIETQIHYPVPCHRQAPYQRFATRPLPVAEESAGEILSLPMFPHMSDGQVARVCDAIRNALGQRDPAENLHSLVE